MLAGIAVLTAASFAIEAALNPLLLRAFPEALPGPEALSTNLWARVLEFAYGLLCVAAGGYVTARVAGRRPMVHVAAMGFVQAGLTVMAMMSPVGNHASRWVWITTAILTMPAALLGGLFYQSRKPKESLEQASAGV